MKSLADKLRVPMGRIEDKVYGALPNIARSEDCHLIPDNIDIRAGLGRITSTIRAALENDVRG